MKATKSNDRLLSSSQFRAVYERGQKFSTPYFSAFVLRTDSGHQRLGLTTTRKIGGAVLRNRCRRRMREIFRLRDRSILAEVGFDVVFNLRTGVASADYKDIKAAFDQMLHRFRRSLSLAKDLE
ncbi:MAG: ribonuclease P protein component [Acidobacteria bacterium]|nr:ribonuclease P protein component [Acidobacteriota bacterium]